MANDKPVLGVFNQGITPTIALQQGDCAPDSPSVPFTG